MKFCCDACKCEQVCDCDDEINPKTSVPLAWFKRNIEDKDYVLCDVCGSIRHFKGGVSAYLLECLNLPDHAHADVSDELCASPRRKKRPRRDWNFNRQ